MTPAVPVPVTVRWYPPEKGGRRTPVVAGRYTPTGRFAEQPLEDMFSVILEMPEPPQQFQSFGYLTPGFPENVPTFGADMTSDRTFLLHEGRKVVAECRYQPFT